MSSTLAAAIATNQGVLVLAGLVAAGLVVVCIYATYSVRRCREAREQQQTKRELAAYVAEGSISPQDAVKLLEAGPDEAEHMIADGVAWGVISPDKAEKLIGAMRKGGEAQPGTPAPR